MLSCIRRRVVCAAFVAILAGSPAAHAQQPPLFSPPSTNAQQTVDVAGAVEDSFKLLFIEHGIRIALQPKTRNQLTGPFWKDYVDSVRVPAHWEDGDSWLVNYLGHPIHGAAAAFVWTSHDPVSRDEAFGLNINYWKTRWRPLVWTAAYSVHFEVGPLSEASIGNVGLDPSTTGWLDYVVTTMANTSSGRVPWHRDRRPLGHR
jgi:hypothetical protein